MDMDNKSGLGKYFYYGADFKRRIVLENFIVANGPAINMGNDKLFTVETVGSPNRVKGVYRSSIIGEGSVYNEELFIPWVFDTYPDGVFTDNDDNVWVGEFGGNVVRKFSNEGELKLEIPLPAWNVTKGAFCKTQNRMFVTSARLQCNEEILERYPQTGGILMVEGLVHC
jgi:sugar lactone lactonase YvrE